MSGSAKAAITTEKYTYELQILTGRFLRAPPKCPFDTIDKILAVKRHNAPPKEFFVMKDRFYRTCLVPIVVLLAMIALRPIHVEAI